MDLTLLGLGPLTCHMGMVKTYLAVSLYDVIKIDTRCQEAVITIWHSSLSGRIPCLGPQAKYM